MPCRLSYEFEQMSIPHSRLHPSRHIASIDLLAVLRRFSLRKWPPLPVHLSRVIEAETVTACEPEKTNRITRRAYHKWLVADRAFLALGECVQSFPVFVLNENLEFYPPPSLQDKLSPAKLMTPEREIRLNSPLVRDFPVTAKFLRSFAESNP
jgi:hypothetical protein